MVWKCYLAEKNTLPSKMEDILCFKSLHKLKFYMYSQMTEVWGDVIIINMKNGDD